MVLDQENIGSPVRVPPRIRHTVETLVGCKQPLSRMDFCESDLDHPRQLPPRSIGPSAEFQKPWLDHLLWFKFNKQTAHPEMPPPVAFTARPLSRTVMRLLAVIEERGPELADPPIIVVPAEEETP